MLMITKGNQRKGSAKVGLVVERWSLLKNQTSVLIKDDLTVRCSPGSPDSPWDIDAEPKIKTHLIPAQSITYLKTHRKWKHDMQTYSVYIQSSLKERNCYSILFIYHFEIAQ